MSGKDDKKKETKKEVTPRVQQSSVASFLNGVKEMLGLAPKKKLVTTLPPPDFNNTFAGNSKGLNILLLSFLDSKDRSELSQVNRGAQEMVYRARIKEEIGSNLRNLIKSDEKETALAAYRRHKAVIHELHSFSLGWPLSPAMLVWRVEEYPDYYFKSLVNDQQFNVTFGSDIFSVLQIIKKERPAAFDLVMKRVIADLDRITRLIDPQSPASTGLYRYLNGEKWYKFFVEFHEEYADQIIGEILANNQLFIRMIPTYRSLTEFISFCNCRPRLEEYSESIRNQVFTHNDIFTHFFGSVEALQGVIGLCVGFYTGDRERREVLAEFILAVEKILNDDKLFALVLGDKNKLQAFRASFSSEKCNLSSKCFLDFAEPEALMLIERAEKRFAEFLKDKASQQDAKSAAPSMRGSNDSNASSSVTTTSLCEASGPAMFASGFSATFDFPQGQASAQEVYAVKEEAKQGPGSSNFSASTSAAGLPAGDNAGASTQTSSGSSSGDLPSGDGEEASGNGPPHR